MPRSEEIGPIEVKGWTGGLNREADPYQLEPDETPDCLNVDFGLRGSVSKRKGFSQYSTDAAVSHTLVEWKGNLIHVRAAGNIRYIPSGSTTSTDSLKSLSAATDARSYVVPAASQNDFLYLTRCTTTTPKKWDGTTWTDVVASDFDGTSARFPRARAVVQAHERMFAFNVLTTAPTAYPSRMHYSDPLDPETWQANDWIDVAPDNGQEITGAVLFGEQIIIFKDHSMYALAGTDETTFTLYPVDTEVGTTCPGTITNVGPELYFFDHLSGVWSFDGASFSKKDDKINLYLLNGVNEDYIYKAVGFAFRGRWLLSVPWGTDTVNSRTFVYDPRIEAWTEYDYGFADAEILGIAPMAVGVNNGNNINQLNNTYTDDGANIDAYVKTTWLAPTTPSVKHRIRRLDLTLSSLGDFNIETIMRRDFSTDTYRSKLINILTGGSLYGSATYGSGTYGSGSDQVLSRTTGWGDRWRVCQFEFAERTNGTFQINRLVMQTSSLDRTRGAH